MTATARTVTDLSWRPISRPHSIMKLLPIFFVILLAACSSTGGHDGGAGSAHSSFSSLSEDSGTPDSTDVTGTVTWPDGEPARNMVIVFYPNGYPFGGQSGGAVQDSTDSQGQYTIRGCGCAALGATYHLGTSRNGGNNCYIIMQTDNGSYAAAASPGDVVNWKMVDMPCSRNYLTPASAASSIALLRSHPEISGGSWQQARQRSGG